MIKIKEIKNKIIWENFVQKYPDGNFLQSWNWGECQQSLNNKIFRLGFYYRDELKGVCELIKLRAKRGTYLVCPGGPLIDFSSSLYFSQFADLVKKIGLKEGCSFVRVRPQILENLANRILFQKQGFVSAPMHLHAQNTWQLDIGKSEEELLKGMRKTTRYLIKKAIKEKVTIIKSHKLSDIDLLYKLQLEVVERRHFVPFSKEYFLAEFKSFYKDNKIAIFKANYRGKVLAIAFIIFYCREAVYHYSGSSASFPKIPASYLLQWEAIKEAKKRGCQTYNFWGIAPTDNPGHRFAGVTLFKKGFGGTRVDYLHAHDLPLKWYYWFIYLFERFRRVLRKL